jgi:hypothetical protein
VITVQGRPSCKRYGKRAVIVRASSNSIGHPGIVAGNQSADRHE